MGKANVDYIIIGQGLAGSALAIHMIEAGLSVIVIDENQSNTSSKVAAGLYNPITGRKMVKTWRADDLFPYLIKFYKNIERLSGKKFLHELPIYRPFVNIEEQNEWMGKSTDVEFRPYIKKIFTKSRNSSLKDSYGGIELNMSGYLDVPLYLSSVRTFLIDKGVLLEEKFDYKDLRLIEKDIHYRNVKGKRLIFCEGVNLIHNRYFSWLPLRPVKGEILEINTKIDFNYIPNRGVFVIPRNNNLRVGSNYNHQDLSFEPTLKARIEIEKKFNELTDLDYKIVNQVAGIRPATKDRKPFIGIHPDIETIGIFNGLGTKGVSLAPFFAREFLLFLESNQNLDCEVNISRFFSLYSNIQHL